MCRRGFLRYAYDQIAKAENICGVFRFCNELKKFVLKENYSFHLFTTHAPCGDASIFSVSSETTENTELPQKRRKISTVVTEKDEAGDILLSSSDRNEIADNFTGAKIIINNFDVPQDLMIQDIGRVRTKPGRGVRTVSMSCSDKLARWNAIGIQGALLSRIIDKPIYLKSITFSKSSEHCNLVAMERAIWKRFTNIDEQLGDWIQIQIQKPIITICTENEFKFGKNSNLEPSPSSIVWSNVDDR